MLCVRKRLSGDAVLGVCLHQQELSSQKLPLQSFYKPGDVTGSNESSFSLQEKGIKKIYNLKSKRGRFGVNVGNVWIYTLGNYRML